ncbi:MAG: c-type cytochrome [Paracoccaceae bacterium]
MKRMKLLWPVPVFFAATAFAHDGVKDPTVLARMNVMDAIADDVKTLGAMAKGEQAFESQTARAAAARMAHNAHDSIALFKDPAGDPKSDALPAIWDDYDDFTEKALNLQSAAQTASNSISTPEDLRTALGEIGQTCKACHRDYRK